MSKSSSSEMYQENLLPVHDQEKDDWYVQKPSRVRKVFQSFCKRRFYTNGVSILHHSVFVTLFITAVYVAYLQGLGRRAPRSSKSFVPQSTTNQAKPSTRIELTEPVGPAPGPVVFTDSADWSGNTSQAAVGWNRWLQNFETHTIAIPTPLIEEFGYEPGLPDTKHSERYGIAMFHQLHCLVRSRHALQLCIIP